MTYSLRLVTEPSVEPVTVADVKTYTRISASAEDTLLSSWISSARRQAESYLGRALITQEWEMSLDCFPRFPLSFPRAPLQSVDSLLYYGVDDTEYTADLDSDWIVDTDREPGRLGLAYGKTAPSTVLRPLDAVKIRFTCGYGDSSSDVPDFVKDAIMLYCASRYENRTGELGTTPKQFFDILTHAKVFL